MSKFSNQPLATIDVPELKASRFLLEENRELPYRDAVGLVNVHLCRQSAEQVRKGAVAPPAEVGVKLEKWLKHAEHWERTGPTWECDGSEWVSSDGQRRAVAKPKAPKSPATASEVPKRKAATAPPDEPAVKKVSQKEGVRQASYDTKSFAAKSTQRVTQVVKGRAAVDAPCPKARSCHVYEQGDDVYDALLNQVNTAHNNNKFYVIQLLESDAEPRQYFCWFRWGRVGEGGQNNLLGPLPLAEAIKAHAKKFKDKTSNEWACRRQFVLNTSGSGGKYMLLKRDYGAPAPPPAAAAAAVPSALDKRVQSLLGLLFDKATLQGGLREIGFDVERSPLGALTRETLAEGMSVLKYAQSPGPSLLIRR
jgi:predicted DNA-binding WGR domain protein